MARCAGPDEDETAQEHAHATRPPLVHHHAHRRPDALLVLVAELVQGS